MTPSPLGSEGAHTGSGVVGELHPRRAAGRCRTLPPGGQGPSAASSPGVPEDARLGPSPEPGCADNPRPVAFLAESRPRKTTAVADGSARLPRPWPWPGRPPRAQLTLSPPASPPRPPRQSAPPLLRPASCGPISTALGGAGRGRGRRRGRAPLMPAGG